MTDLELRGLDGSVMDAAVRAKQLAQAGGGGGAKLTADEAAELSLTWADLQVRHTEHNEKYWQECRALYAGGARLLCDDAVMSRLFPSNLFEDKEVYAERKKRAHYFPYPGTILDHLVAGLGSDPLRVSFAETDDKGKITTPAGSEWWEGWIGDVTGDAEDMDEPEGSSDDSGVSLHEFMSRVTREAEQVRVAWVLCEIEDEDEPAAQIDGENAAAPASGEIEPCVRIIPAEQVIDWQTTKRGDLVWVLTLEERKVRETLKSRRDTIEQTYTLWTDTTCVTYVVQFDPKTPPAADKVIAPTTATTHDFARVPFIRFELPEGMWGMGKMHSLAREHLNKRCAMSWAEYKALFPILYEFHGVEDANGMPVPSAQQDRNRATAQLRAQGYTQTRGAEDRAEFVGPSSDAFKAARDGTNDIMREMHRVMFAMALSADMDSAALQRSGESKSEDNAPTEVILDFLGLWIRQNVRRLLALVARGRNEALPARTVSGLAHFDIQGVSDAIGEATSLFAGVPQKSTRFTELYLGNLYAKILGDVATQQDREEIRAQIAEQVSAEEMLADAQASLAQDTAENGGVPPGQETDPEDAAEGDEPPSKPGAPRGPMFSSKSKKK